MDNKKGVIISNAGDYSNIKKYVRTKESAPVVKCDGEWYMLKKEGTVIGINPKFDYDENGDNAHWIRINKFEYTQIDILENYVFSPIILN